MDQLQKLINAFEIHSVTQIQECFAGGLDPNQTVNGKPLVYELINMYTRGPRFKECIRAFISNGLIFEDEVLLAVLADDAPRLDQLLVSTPEALHCSYTLQSTFTPLFEASLLHIAAEYGHINAAKVLVRHGAAINAPAGTDEQGFGAHTPIFHTVNQDANKGMDMLQFLLAEGADLSVTVKGLIWGKGYQWETFIPDVNPISYAMMGLLRQFQRTEEQIYEIVQLLLKAKYGIAYKPGNIPNQYLIQ